MVRDEPETFCSPSRYSIIVLWLFPTLHIYKKPRVTRVAVKLSVLNNR